MLTRTFLTQTTFALLVSSTLSLPLFAMDKTQEPEGNRHMSGAGAVAEAEAREKHTKAREEAERARRTGDWDAWATANAPGKIEPGHD